MSKSIIYVSLILNSVCSLPSSKIRKQLPKCCGRWKAHRELRWKSLSRSENPVEIQWIQIQYDRGKISTLTRLGEWCEQCSFNRVRYENERQRKCWLLGLLWRKRELQWYFFIGVEGEGQACCSVALPRHLCGSCCSLRHHRHLREKA